MNSKAESLISFLIGKVVMVLAICGLVRECYAEQDAQREMRRVDKKIAQYRDSLVKASPVLQR